MIPVDCGSTVVRVISGADMILMIMVMAIDACVEQSFEKRSRIRNADRIQYRGTGDGDFVAIRHSVCRPLFDQRSGIYGLNLGGAGLSDLDILMLH